MWWIFKWQMWTLNNEHWIDYYEFLINKQTKENIFNSHSMILSWEFQHKFQEMLLLAFEFIRYHVSICWHILWINEIYLSKQMKLISIKLHIPILYSIENYHLEWIHVWKMIFRIVKKSKNFGCYCLLSRLLFN